MKTIIKNKNRIRVLILGDSLALPRPGVQLNETYGSLLQRELSKTNLEAEVINRAKGAQSIIGIHEKLSNHLSEFQPDIVILHVGIVDCWPRNEFKGLPQTSLQQFSIYYNRIINLIKNRKQTKLIIIGICPTSKRMDTKYPGTLQQIKEYNRILMSEGNQQQIFFIDMEKHISLDHLNTYLLPDDQHLNPAGNKLVYNLINELLMKV